MKLGLSLDVHTDNICFTVPKSRLCKDQLHKIELHHSKVVQGEQSIGIHVLIQSISAVAE